MSRVPVREASEGEHGVPALQGKIGYAQTHVTKRHGVAVNVGDGPSADMRMAYAHARLRMTDEARSAALAADRRVYQPDPDETERPCGARRTR